MSEQDLRLNVSAKGGDKAAGEVAKVTEAQAKLGKATGSTAKPTKQLTDQQKKLNAAESDYITLLTQANPQLGVFVDSILKAIKVTGDLADKSINLNTVSKKLTSSLVKNAGAIKLLGAAGVAFAGFKGLLASMNEVKRQANEVEAAIKKLTEIKTGEQEEIIEGQKDVRALARGRREGGFSADEAKQADETFEQIKRIGRVKDEELLKKNVAALTGLVSGQDIEKLTIAGVEPGFEASPRGRKARAESRLRRPETGELFDREIDTQHSIIARSREEAAKEAVDPTQGEANLKALIERISINKGNADLIREIVREALPEAGPGPTPRELEDAVQDAAEEIFRKQAETNSAVGDAVSGGVRTFIGADALLTAQVDAISVLHEILAEMRKERGRQDELASEQFRQRNEVQTTVIQAPNSTFNGPGMTRRDLTVNGETELDAIRGGY